MNFEQILQNRRSIRKYQDKPVAVDVIKELIKESTLAPSSGNAQPWKYSIVMDRDLMKRMSDESKKNILARIAANPNDYAKRYEKMLQNEAYNVFFNAPCLVVIFGKKDLKNLFVDCALAGSYLMMAATARDLGTCWINLGAAIEDPSLLQELGIEDDSRIIAPIILGYPEIIPPTPERRPPEIIKIIS